MPPPQQFSAEQAALLNLVDRYSRTKVRGLLLRSGSAVAALAQRDALELGSVGLRLDPGLQTLRAALVRSDCHIVFAPALPQALMQIPDPPLLLYCRGNLSLLERRAIALVGARRSTLNGRDFAFKVGAELAALDLVVVSGLALGIDGAAHQGALTAGSTIAVLGSGVDRCYPARHNHLAQRILDAGGLIVSEYPLGTTPRPGYFPERNRIISGLSEGLVVVEASERSGSLITARLALEQGREVMAVPGSVASPISVGCHRLIQQGAALVTGTADILRCMNLLQEQQDNPQQSTSSPKLSQQEQLLVDLIGGAPVTLDRLTAETGLGAAKLSALLTGLELQGFVRLVADGYIRPAL